MENYKLQPVLKYKTNSGKHGGGSAVCTPRSRSDTSSFKDNFSFACLTLYQRRTSLAFQTSQLVAQSRCMKQPESVIAPLAVTSISAEPLPNQMSSQKKTKIMT